MNTNKLHFLKYLYSMNMNAKVPFEFECHNAI